MLRPVLALALVAAGCSGPRPASPEAPALAPPTAAASADRATGVGVARDPLAAVVPVLRVVAGQADTLVAQDLFGRATVAVPPADGPVRLRSLGGGRLVLEADAGAAGLFLVPITADGAPAAVAVQAAVQPEVTFRFEPDLTTADGPPPEVFVIGGFNDWSRTDTPLRPQPDGALAATVPVAPGRYEYKLTVGGVEVLDPASRDSVANPFGAYNNVLVVAPPVEGGLVVRVAGAEPGDPSQLIFTVRSVGADGRESPPAEVDDDDGAVVLDGNRVLDDNAVYFDPDGGELTVDLDAVEPGLRRLRVAVRDGARVSRWVEVPLWDRRPLSQADGSAALAPATSVPADAPPAATATPSGTAPASGERPAPFTWNDAVVYQVVVDRFFDGDPANTAPVGAPGLDPRADYQGGDLAGVLAKLRDGYFDRLGVNALWLSPVIDNPDRAYREFPEPHRLYAGYHGYWPVRPRAVEERFGTMDDLRAVVAEAHARRIYVLLDFVSNHVHQDHPYVAEHPEWFGTVTLPDGSLNVRRFDEYRLTTWFEPYLPSFDYVAAPAAVAQVADDAAWWLEQSGADGFRHDAVKHVPNAFWRAVTERLAAVERPQGAPPLFQIGETFGSYGLVASYVVPGQLDAQFNFALYDAAVGALTRDGSMGALADEMDASLRVFGPLHRMGNPIDSHDKPRFLALVEGDIDPDDAESAGGWGPTPPRVDRPESYRRQALALAYTLTTPGVPVVYYGDEVGMTGANDPDNRRFMVWDGLTPEQTALRDQVSALVRLRRATPALRLGTFETLWADDDVWVYRRTAPGSDVVVALNAGDADRTLTAADVPALAGVTADLLAPTATASGALRVPAGGYRVVGL